MKPKIVTRLANIFAKLASSSDYDPTVKPKLPIEYYADQIPVLPKPGTNDNGKIPTADSNGGYALTAPIVPTPGADDVGKVPTADSDGTYILIAPTVEVSPDAVAGAISDMDDNEVAVVESRLNYVVKPVVTAVSGATPTIALCEDNHIYECGELTSLTITAFDNPGKFWIWFTSGATPTVITGIDNFTPEENKKYRVFVENGYATFDAWTVGGVS